jgi:hypothetical protein
MSKKSFYLQILIIKLKKYNRPMVHCVVYKIYHKPGQLSRYSDGIWAER